MKPASTFHDHSPKNFGYDCERPWTRMGHVEAMNSSGRAAKLEVIGRLAVGIAHEFNNQLSIINGYADLLLCADLPESLRGFAESIRDAGERSTCLVRPLLDEGRTATRPCAPTSLNEVVAETTSLLGRLLPGNIALTTRLEKNGPMVLADPDSVQGAIINLALNARDAMPNGGTLELATTSLQLDATFTKCRPPLPPGDYVLLTVTDNGAGIDEATRARVFEPFFTTKQEGCGTGLGLAIVEQFLRQCGGSVAVVSAEGWGTCFELYFPRLAGAPAEPENPAPRGRPGCASEAAGTPRPIILVVDDEAAVAELICRTLDNAGFSTLSAANGKEALLLLSADVDLVITDLVMPELEGLELLKHLRNDWPLLPVIAVSGAFDGVYLGPAARLGARVVLRKPFTPDVLVSAVRSALG